ncbi:hypothetical protein [Nonomuraea sp. NPDC049480]|uniref:hypothetical protein n=1 Tax=Nonomuraea sp. NPDC049480 TaxID=3364353 RepID=UPI0037993CA3
MPDSHTPGPSTPREICTSTSSSVCATVPSAASIRISRSGRSLPAPVGTMKLNRPGPGDLSRPGGPVTLVTVPGTS